MSIAEKLFGPGLRVSWPPPKTTPVYIPKARSMQPRPYQIDGINFLSTNKRAILSDAPGLGKAGTVDSKVLTPTGWKRMGDIAVGDAVITADGTSTQIVGVYPQGKQPTYKVSFTDGSSTECTAEHLWLTFYFDGRRREKLVAKVSMLAQLANDLRWQDNRRKHRIPLVNPVHFVQDNELPLHPYLLGVLLGDGSFAGHAVMLASDDAFIIDKVRSILPDGLSIVARDDQNYGITHGQPGKSNPVIDALRSLRLWGNRAPNKHVPRDYLFSSVQDRIALLQGLMDTDGYVNESGAVIQFSSASYQLCEDVKFLVQSLGGTARYALKSEVVYKYEDTLREGLPAHLLTISMPAKINPFLLPRKANRAFLGHAKYPPARYIDSISPAGIKDCQCIAVEHPSRLYVTDDFIVTHNTFQACEAAVGNTVISCPLPLVEQWASFIEDQYPDKPVHIAAYRDRIIRDKAMRAFEHEGGWLIINHDTWRSYFVPDAQTLILDEYHHFRNRDAERSKQVRIYSTKRPSLERIYGLTATPIFKDIGDLWHLLHILEPLQWRSYWQFLNTWADTYSGAYGTKIIRARDLDLLEKKTAHLMLGRNYKEVGLFLPERIDKDIVLKMDARSRKTYNTLRDYYRLELESDSEEDEAKKLFSAGAVLHALRKLTVTPAKLDAVKEIIEETPGDSPIIIFTWYRETAHHVRDYLKTGVVITGEDKPAERRVLANTGGEAKHRIRIATMESLSEGVDLSDARTVIYVEETYVPGQQYQSLSRVMRHRTSSTGTDPIIAYWIRYEGTVDTVVHNTARQRLSGNALTVLREALL